MTVRVLLVDDCEDVREAATRLLEHRGYTVGAAASVESAHAASFQPDVIVSDFDLPDGNHDDVARKWPDVPLVVISGYPPVEGFVGRWLKKPFTAAELISAIELAVREPT